MDEANRKEDKLSYRQEAANRLKYRRHNFRLPEHQAAASPYPRQLRLLHQPEDLLLTIAFCSPYNQPLEPHKIRLGRLLRLDTMMLVRGKTLLTDLRDRISCPSDFGSSRDISDNPREEAGGHDAKKDFPSGFFYISGTFYDDLRHPKAKLLSAPVVRWAKTNRSGVDPDLMASKDMKGVTIGDLKLRFGQPQLYVHQGSCEHLFMVTTGRLMGPDDPVDLDAYPFPITRKAKNRVSCHACKHYIAKFVVRGSTRVPYDPHFLCAQCLTSFHYDKNGKKIGQFSVSHYFDKSALVP